ncbi:MAG: hypothetical protein KDH96_05165 [Candidatus Riesia sp.]|nr:hypothetical protein [Candidatus Riesia sp.]
MSSLKDFIFNSQTSIEHIITAVTESSIKCYVVVANEMIKKYFINTCPAITGQVLTLSDIELIRSTDLGNYCIIWHDSIISLATKEMLSTKAQNDFMEE